jgi:uncharacterized Tic20 family protein
MGEEGIISQEERVLAGVAHGSILLGVVTSGIGGIGAALLIWLLQKGKSAYVAAQALQALVYQMAVLIVTFVVWCAWGALWLVILLPPLIANPDAYEHTPPAGLWVGLILMVIPIAFSVLTTLYALWGAVRCLGGHDFRYAVVGNWLESQA